jgi:hypothetical protein
MSLLWYVYIVVNIERKYLIIIYHHQPINVSPLLEAGLPYG